MKRRSEDKTEIDIKQYAKVEKTPGGRIKGSTELKGVRFNKDGDRTTTKRRSKNPRIRLLGCHLENRKGNNLSVPGPAEPPLQTGRTRSKRKTSGQRPGSPRSGSLGTSTSP